MWVFFAWVTWYRPFVGRNREEEVGLPAALDCKGLATQLFYLYRMKANIFGEITRVPHTLV